MFLEPRFSGHSGGCIEVICGSMFSGKTEELIRRIRRAQIAGRRTAVFKPALDNRYDRTHIVSHNDNRLISHPVQNASELLAFDEKPEVVGIDEAQFFDKDLPHVCNRLADAGIRVIAAGLDMDHRGAPFGPMPHLLAIAEHVTKLHAVCSRTGGMAHYSYRKTEDEEQVRLGARDHYEPLSREAFRKLKR